MLINRKILNRTRRGQGIVEFALVLPLLLLLIYGIVEAGRLLFIYSTVLTSSREAVRYGSAAGDVGGRKEHFRDCDGIRTSAKRIGAFAGVKDSNILISYDSGPGGSVVAASCPPTAPVDLGDRVIVQVSAAYQPLVPLVQFKPVTITGVSRRTIVKDVQVEGTPPSSPTPRVSFEPPEVRTVSEAVGGTDVRILVSVASNQNITVPFVVSGSATPGADFSITSANPATIQPGRYYAVIDISIVGDAMDEENETIVLTMGSPTNANKGTPSIITINIEDDDPPPEISFNQANQNIPEGGSSAATVRLSTASSKNIYAVVTVSGTASQGAGADYTVSTTDIYIPAGSTQASVVISTQGDIVDEDDETITLTLGSVTNATLGSPGTHNATLVDDDTTTISFSWPSQSAEEDDQKKAAEITLSTPSSKLITLAFDTSGVAQNNTDYTIGTQNPISIQPGQTLASLEFTVIKDEAVESEEQFAIRLQPPQNASLGTPSEHVVTIINTTLPIPSVYFVGSSKSVGEAVGNFTLRIQLSSAYDQTVTVPYSVMGTATPGVDFTIASSPTIIPIGGAGRNILIEILPDTLDESDETIVVTLGPPTNGTLGSPTVYTVTIQDDDVAPVAQFASSGQGKNEDAGTVLVTVQLSAISGQAVSVPFTVTGTANQGTQADYTISSSPLTIPAGSQSADILVTLNNDKVIAEPNETITISMGTPVNATVGSPVVHTVTVFDNDPMMCPTAGVWTFYGNATYLTLTLYNTEAGAVNTRITSMLINWYHFADTKFNALDFGASRLWEGVENNSPTTLNQANFLVTGDRQLTAGETKILTFRFNKQVLPANASYYYTTINFDNGCSISR